MAEEAGLQSFVTLCLVLSRHVIDPNEGICVTNPPMASNRQPGFIVHSRLSFNLFFDWVIVRIDSTLLPLGSRGLVVLYRRHCGVL